MAAVIQSARFPAPSWDEEVVPALRKRLESESRTLARRLSAISISSQDAPPNFAILAEATINPAATPRALRPVLEHSSADRPRAYPNGTTPLVPKRKTPSPVPRSRTYSQPFSTDPSNAQKPLRKSPDPSRRTPDNLKPTRIPKASSRANISPSMSLNSQPSTPIIPVTNGYHHLPPDSFPGLLNEPPPFPQHTTSNPVPRRSSTDSEEHPFEHWYRGEAARNGGVGELKIGRRQEMLDIANYGYTVRANQAREDAAHRKRADSVSHIEAAAIKARHRSSFLLDEDPLTDIDGSSDMASFSEHNHAGPLPHRQHSLTSVPSDDPPERRSATPMPLVPRRSSSLLQNGVQSRIPGPSSRRGSESPSRTSTSMSRGPSTDSTLTPTAASPSTSTLTPPPPAVTPTPGLGPRHSQPSRPTPVSRKRAASPSSTTSASPTPKKSDRKSKTTPPKASRSKTRKELEDEAYRRSVAQYPTPNDDELIHAIPSWTQPVPRARNWDDVVLPVVARKKGLDDQYEVADGNEKPKKVEEVIAPAPGTFGFKYRTGTAREESIPLDEFGVPLPPSSPQSPLPLPEEYGIILEEPLRTEPESEPEPEPQLELEREQNGELPVYVKARPKKSLRDEDVRPPSPPPFSAYAPVSEKVVVAPGGGIVPRMEGRGEGGRGQVDVFVMEGDADAGCCKCVIM